MTEYRARAVISTEALCRNLDHVREHAGVDAMAVVKADAYGHGVEHLAPMLREHGVRWLGVALPSEAMALRRAGDTGNILAWLSAPGEPAISECVAAHVDLSVSSLRELTEIATAAQLHRVTANIHIKIDTGLSRNGVLPSELDALLDSVTPLIAARYVHVRGVWSHLASADHTDTAIAVRSVQDQIAVFDAALATCAAHGITPDIRHLANTAGALWHPASRYDLVRVGIGMYGLSPNFRRATSQDLGLVPAMHVQARLASIKTIPQEAGVSYSHTWTAERPTRVGLVPVGYADGVPRNLSNQVEFAIAGHRVAQIGTIAMDQCVVNLESAVDATVGHVVDLYGSGSSGELTADQWAEHMNTVGYEIVTRMGGRIPREYT
ncbi:MAG: alanine racemase [Candidatus Nanopelagicales bacterium]|nr:alanine racemase [Candidatus Nanopelagicales bacterium]